MLKYFMLLTFVVALLHAAPIEEDEKAHTTKRPHHVEIIESENEHKQDGSYSFSYRGDDGSFREETAVLVNPGTQDEHLEITGSYSFINTDGEEVQVHYTADKNGFVPVGSNIPDEITKAAQHNADSPRKDTHQQVDSVEA